jgi:hypothetical protein
MVVIYEFTGTTYHPAVVIDEQTGKVTGTSALADYFRDVFQYLRDGNVTPEKHMDKIKPRIYENYRNIYYWAE